MKRISIYLSLFQILFLVVAARAQQYEYDYAVSLYKGKLPNEFVSSPTNFIKNELNNSILKNKKSKLKEKNLIYASNYEIKELFLSGYVLFGDTITQYVRAVSEEIIKVHPDLAGKFKIYVVRSTDVNAYCFENGTIFVNIGLIAKLENEAELAYILCHEFVHYMKGHSLKRVLEFDKIDKQKEKRRKMADKNLLKYKFSKENETEADTMGLTLYSKTGYKIKSAISALEMLQYAELPFEETDFDFSIFESKNYKLPSSYFLAVTNPIKDEDKRDDSYLTHPNIYKRKNQVTDLMKNYGNNTDSILYLVSKEYFETVREICRFECSRMFLVERDYLNALKWSYLLKKKYPQNKFAEKIFSKSLYALTLYKNGDLRYDNNSFHQNAIADYTKVEGKFQQLNYFFTSIPALELNVLTSKYLFSNYLNNDFTDKIYFNFTDSVLCRLFEKTGVDIEVFEHADIEKIYYSKAFYEFESNDEFKALLFKQAMANSRIAGVDLKTFKLRKRNIKPTGKYVGSISNVVIFNPVFDYEKYNKKRYHKSFKISQRKKEKLVKSIEKRLKRKDVKSNTVDAENFSIEDGEEFNNYINTTLWLNERLDAGSDSYYNVLATDDINLIVQKQETPYILYVEVESKELKNRQIGAAIAVFILYGGSVVPIPFLIYKVVENPKDISMNFYLMNIQTGEMIKHTRHSRIYRNLNKLLNKQLKIFFKSV